MCMADILEDNVYKFLCALTCAVWMGDSVNMCEPLLRENWNVVSKCSRTDGP